MGLNADIKRILGKIIGFLDQSKILGQKLLCQKILWKHNTSSKFKLKSKPQQFFETID